MILYPVFVTILFHNLFSCVIKQLHQKKRKEKLKFQYLSWDVKNSRKFSIQPQMAHQPVSG